MNAVPPTKVSIIIVNYKTPTQTRLCLRSLRKYTSAPCETIVVDNRSKDESMSYLKHLPWIRFFENPAHEPNHRNGLDLGIRHSSGDSILILHTDTFVRHAGWLDAIVGRMDEGAMMVGTDDRVILPFRGLGRIDLWWKRFKRWRRWKKRERPPKIMSFAALYRRELFTEHGQRFDHPEWIDGEYNDCGEFIQRYCEEKGFGIRRLRCEELSRFLWHFEAATLNLVTGRPVPAKRQRLARWFYSRPDVQAILQDVSLDH